MGTAKSSAPPSAAGGAADVITIKRLEGTDIDRIANNNQMFREFLMHAPPLSSTQVKTWAETVDIVIVGFGCAGACAALEAETSGAQVLVVERFDGGGATAVSGGVYYGGGTPHQEAAGFHDDAGEMYRYLRAELGEVVSDATLRRFCDDNAANLAWLEEQGVPFGSAFSPENAGYPGNGIFLYYTGNEATEKCRDIARPAPRGHRTVGSGATGRVLWEKLEAAVARRGIPVWRQSPVTRLIIDERGAVVGIEVNRLDQSDLVSRHRALWQKTKRRLGVTRSKGAERFAAAFTALEARSSRRRYVRVRRGVILATGGFVYNRPMIRENAPLYAHGTPLGLPSCDGSGIEMGLMAGGIPHRMDRICAARSISPPTEFIEGVIVDAAGKRLVNEDSATSTLGRTIAESEGGTAWVILDRRMRNTALRKSMPRRGRMILIHCLPALMIIFFGSRKARDIATLARKCNLPPAVLERTIAEYNVIAASPSEDPLGKKKSLMKPVVQPPFYALDISRDNATAPLATFTLGGLRVAEDSGQVVRADGSAINGLYAIGRAAAGLASSLYIGGLSIADCVFSGRRAARHAVSERAAKIVDKAAC
jgi:3-oxo-5alpha-steroid 4-dehydrogenase